jgi:mRNA-degrading endonuclease toxin of MazEF toxin-antitoxin module
MDIAQVRGTTAELAAAEQRVAAFKAELARQAHGAQSDGPAAVEAITVIPKRARSGWLPATG